MFPLFGFNSRVFTWWYTRWKPLKYLIGYHYYHLYHLMGISQVSIIGISRILESFGNGGGTGNRGNRLFLCGAA